MRVLAEPDLRAGRAEADEHDLGLELLQARAISADSGRVLLEPVGAPTGDVETGVSARSRSTAAAFTSSWPPTIATRSPRRAASRHIAGRRSAPVTRLGSSRPVRRATATTGTPSASAPRHRRTPPKALVLRQLDDVVDVRRHDVREPVEVGQTIRWSAVVARSTRASSWPKRRTVSSGSTSGHRRSAWRPLSSRPCRQPMGQPRPPHACRARTPAALASALSARSFPPRPP